LQKVALLPNDIFAKPDATNGVSLLAKWNEVDKAASRLVGAGGGNIGKECKSRSDFAILIVK
jgi:hypothetical protein